MHMDQVRFTTIGEIESKEFKIAAKGYDRSEVDTFLDTICDEMERLEMENQSLTRKVELAGARERQAEGTPVMPPMPEVQPGGGTVSEILEMAQQLKAQTLETAQEQAREIIAAAEAEAAARLGSLEAEKEALTRQLETLKAAAADYKTRFAAMLDNARKALSEAEDME